MERWKEQAATRRKESGKGEFASFVSPARDAPPLPARMAPAYTDEAPFKRRRTSSLSTRPAQRNPSHSPDLPSNGNRKGKSKALAGFDDEEEQVVVLNAEPERAEEEELPPDSHCAICLSPILNRVSHSLVSIFSSWIGKADEVLWM